MEHSIHNRVLHQALARSLRESKIQFVGEDKWPLRERGRGQNCILNPLPMDIITEAGTLFHNHPRRKNKVLLLDITIVNPCAGSNLENAAHHARNRRADAVERKKNKYRGSFASTYSLLPLAMSTCGEVGSDVHALMKELAIRRVEHRSGIHSNESHNLAEWAEVAVFGGDFLLFYSRHFLSSSLQTEGGACEHPTAPFARPGV